MFKKILQNVVEQTPGAQSAVLMGCDGIEVDHFLASAGSAETDQALVVEFASIIKEISHTVSLLSVGTLEEVTVKCQNMTIVLALLTPEYFVALLVGSGGNTGKGRYLLKRDMPVLREGLE
jgi:predicted regulator of Ras-like GTPase activity (Roadblock/LC7/MglB family)